MPDDIDLKQAFDRAAGSAPNAPPRSWGCGRASARPTSDARSARGGAGLLGVVAVGGVIMNIGGDGSGTDVAVDGRGRVGHLRPHVDDLRIDDVRIDVCPDGLDRGVDDANRHGCVQLVGADDWIGDDNRPIDPGDVRARPDDKARRPSSSRVHLRGRHDRR